MAYKAKHKLQFFFTLDSLAFIVKEPVAIIIFNISFKIVDLFSGLFVAIDRWLVKASFLQASHELLNVCNKKTLRESHFLAADACRLLPLIFFELRQGSKGLDSVSVTQPVPAGLVGWQG